MSAAETHWVVAVEESLGALLERLGEQSALQSGRVFIDGQRASAETLMLSPGARVEIYRARETPPKLRVLAERDGLVFVEKPLGIATEPERRGSDTALTSLAARELGVPIERVHALTRLDVGVSGVVLLGLDTAARRDVMALRADGDFERRYVAVALGAPTPTQGTWNEPIRRIGAGARRGIATHGEPAETRFRVTGVSALPRLSILALQPLTGRTHQLRVHSAAHGAPLLGDTTYGGPRRLTLPTGRVLGLERIFLHAAWIRVGAAAPVECPLPPEFEELWRACAGEPSALAEAASAASAH